MNTQIGHSLTNPNAYSPTLETKSSVAEEIPRLLWTSNVPTIPVFEFYPVRDESLPNPHSVSSAFILTLLSHLRLDHEGLLWP